MPHLFRIFVPVFVLAFAVAPMAHAAEVVEVFVDARDPAYVVLQGIARDAPPLAVREMHRYAILDRVSIVAWDNFRQNIQALLAPYMVKNEYPGSRAMLGIVTLVKMHPGRPYAVTWNGGLASTFQDYQYAVTTFEAFSEDADAYERSRPRDRTDDPLHPDNQLMALLPP